MADLDNLLGSKLSLINHSDVRFNGVLFSINAAESSIVLKNVKCLGTEERVTEEVNKVSYSPVLLPFVTFPGNEIKDLYVFEDEETEQKNEDAKAPHTPQKSGNSQDKGRNKNPPRPPTESTNKSAPSKNKDTKQNQSQPQHVSQAKAKTSNPKIIQADNKENNQQQQQQQHQGNKQSSTSKRDGNTPTGPAAGTGEHLLKMRVKKSSTGVGNEVVDATGEFNFEEGLSQFNKEDIPTEETSTDLTVIKYKKDDFFDCLSSESTVGRTKYNAEEERNLNTDTFGAIALQSGYRSYTGRSRRGGGYRGRGGGRGRGRGKGGFNNSKPSSGV